ncbi:MAG: hypothetical protein M3247_07630 [Thermoproteota archaeon]|nr:hypothetical protein [Thermoproteota archaeon]
MTAISTTKMINDDRPNLKEEEVVFLRLSQFFIITKKKKKEKGKEVIWYSCQSEGVLAESAPSSLSSKFLVDLSLLLLVLLPELSALISWVT